MPKYNCSKYGPDSQCTIRDWVSDNHVELARSHTDFLIMMLDQPRENWYSSTDYLEI